MRRLHFHHGKLAVIAGIIALWPYLGPLVGTAVGAGINEWLRRRARADAVAESDRQREFQQVEARRSRRSVNAKERSNRLRVLAASYLSLSAQLAASKAQTGDPQVHAELIRKLGDVSSELLVLVPTEMEKTVHSMREATFDVDARPTENADGLNQSVVVYQTARRTLLREIRAYADELEAEDVPAETSAPRRPTA